LNLLITRRYKKAEKITRLAIKLELILIFLLDL